MASTRPHDPRYERLAGVEVTQHVPQVLHEYERIVVRLKIKYKKDFSLIMNLKFSCFSQQLVQSTYMI